MVKISVRIRMPDEFFGSVAIPAISSCPKIFAELRAEVSFRTLAPVNLAE